MKSIAMFNNKGGVGKTTLTNNIASFLALQKGLRILVVDCDPQCNTTQLILGQHAAYEMYWELPQGSTRATTIGDILRPIQEGEPAILQDITPIVGSSTRFGVDLIPGDPKFSMVEDKLGAAWHLLKGGEIASIRQTNWNTFLLRILADRYDYIFFDLGPSLGSINRSVLIGCDYFITPMGTDIFSILGIKNIAEWIKNWIETYNNGIIQCERQYPGRLADYSIPSEPAILKGYLGYTAQQYITKSIRGERRPTRSYDAIISNIPNEVQSSLSDFIKPGLSLDDLKLGDVPHLYSLIPLAQSNASPLIGLKGVDGLVGSQFKQVEEYGRILEGIGNKIIHNSTH